MHQNLLILPFVSCTQIMPENGELISDLLHTQRIFSTNYLID